MEDMPLPLLLLSRRTKNFQVQFQAMKGRSVRRRRTNQLPIATEKIKERLLKMKRKMDSHLKARIKYLPIRYAVHFSLYMVYILLVADSTVVVLVFLNV